MGRGSGIFDMFFCSALKCFFGQVAPPSGLKLKLPYIWQMRLLKKWFMERLPLPPKGHGTNLKSSFEEPTVLSFDDRTHTKSTWVILYNELPNAGISLAKCLQNRPCISSKSFFWCDWDYSSWGSFFAFGLDSPARMTSSNMEEFLKTFAKSNPGRRPEMEPVDGRGIQSSARGPMGESGDGGKSMGFRRWAFGISWWFFEKESLFGWF